MLSKWSFISILGTLPEISPTYHCNMYIQQIPIQGVMKMTLNFTIILEFIIRISNINRRSKNTTAKAACVKFLPLAPQKQVYF